MHSSNGSEPNLATAITKSYRLVPFRAWLAIGSILLATGIAALYLPFPDLAEIRSAANALGQWFPAIFFLAHVVVCLFPIPRSLFTWAASVIFTPWLALPLCLGAALVSAAITVTVVRPLGYRSFQQFRSVATVHRIDEHLRHRGWPAIAALRMVPAVPFSILNYAAAVSSVGVVPFMLATAAGLTPGTAATIFLGNAITTGGGNVAIFASAAFALVGIAGLIIDARTPLRLSRDKRTKPIAPL